MNMQFAKQPPKGFVLIAVSTWSRNTKTWCFKKASLMMLTLSWSRADKSTPEISAPMVGVMEKMFMLKGYQIVKAA